MTGGQDGDRCLRDGSSVFHGDDFRHGLFLREGSGVQQGLRQAIAHRCMKWLTPAAVLIKVLRVVAELRNVSAFQKRRNFAAQIVDMIFTTERRIAAGDARYYHIGTIPECDLAVLQLQHHRDYGRRLDNLFKTWRKCFAVKDKTVLPGARLDRHQVAMHVAGSSQRTNDRSYAHGSYLCSVLESEILKGCRIRKPVDQSEA